MPVTASSAALGVADDWLVSDTARAALANLDGPLRAAVASDSRELEEMALQLVGLPGKRVRPALALLAAELGDPDPDRLTRVAVGVELLHIASLYHDDIMDRAALRRGAPTAASRWGPALSAVAGSFVANRGLAQFARDDALVRLVSRALTDLATGQLREVQNAFALDLPPQEHLAIVALKTGTLFRLPCQVGAAVAGLEPAPRDALARYGGHLGIAFQLADDALDLEGDPTETGKPLAGDLREGSYGLAILLAGQALGPLPDTLRRLLRKPSKDAGDLRALVEMLHESGAVAEAHKVAENQRDKAIAAAEELPDGPPRASLIRLAAYATERTR
jgi:heptaprenyl diphosphate synthase